MTIEVIKQRRVWALVFAFGDEEKWQAELALDSFNRKETTFFHLKPALLQIPVNLADKQTLETLGLADTRDPEAVARVQDEIFERVFGVQPRKALPTKRRKRLT